MSWKISPLGRVHAREGFSCGESALDHYITKVVSQDVKRMAAACYVAHQEDGRVAGYYTLSSSSVTLCGLDENFQRKLPRYPQVPCTLLGRLAVDRAYQGGGLGEILLHDAMARSLLASLSVASACIVVDAKDDRAERFYEKRGFTRFKNAPGKLYLPMAVVAKICG